MRIGRCLPPAAAPLTAKNILNGFKGLSGGQPELDRFEKELSSYFGVKHAFLVSSGKAALTAILQALKEMSPGRDEVLIPAFTCYSVPSAIIRAGLKVRLCDLAPGTFDFDYGQLSEIISANKDHLLCIVPVHLFGFPADLERIRDIIADDSVFIVEDAAQAMGGAYKGKKMGTIVDAGLFSLGRGKALSTVEGGVILTKRDDIAWHLEKTVNAIPCYDLSELLSLLFYALALFVLSRPTLFWLPKALPFLRLGETIYDPNFKMRRMSPFQAGVSRGWERKLQKLRRKRTENVLGWLKRLNLIDIRPLWAENNSQPDLIRFPLKIDSISQREIILSMSEHSGLGIACTYPDSVDSIRGLNHDFADSHFPNAKEYAKKFVTLPVHLYITENDRDKIIDLLKPVDAH